jgi:hypothetical protein
MDYGWSLFPAGPAPEASQSGDQIVWTWPEYNFGQVVQSPIYYFRRSNDWEPGPFGDNGDEIGNECITDFETIDGKYFAITNDSNGKILVANWSPVGYAEVETPTSVENLADDYQICQNYPNPFNPVTTIEYSVVNPGNVQLIIYNQLGQQIETLVNEVKPAGNHTAVWNASNFPTGRYIYQLKTETKSITRKMDLVK